MFQNRKLKRNATSTITEIAEVALCPSLAISYFFIYVSVHLPNLNAIEFNTFVKDFFVFFKNKSWHFSNGVSYFFYSYGF